MKTFDLRVFTATRKDNGEQFKYYKAYELDDKNNTKYTDVKFTKAVETLPLEACFIDVEDADWNLNEKGTYPCYWIKKITNIILRK